MDGAPGQQEETVTIFAPDAAPASAQADPPAPASELAGAPVVGATETPEVAALAPVVAPTRRPTKFLADLTRAMQAAAEQARTATLEQFRGDGTTVTEQIQARSAAGATELRHRADDDVAAIKDWSKAEIAHIRDQTERRIGARREQLEGQLERHSALVEHEIEKVRGRIAAFEAEMGQFFDGLVGEDDPAAFAARATHLPEPPSFEDLDDAMTALLREPGVGIPEPVVEEVVEAAPEPVVEPEVDVVTAEPQGTQDAVAEDAPLDREAALSAIQAAAEAATALETGEAPVEVEAQGAPDVTAPDQRAPDPWAPAPAEPEADPRLAMLGLTPSFAAAELAAAELAAAEIDGDALAARLSGAVSGDEPTANEAAATTRVVVTGLASVASIASFKRHVGRLAGVGHVGVSSGPDAEFVFVVSHDPATSLPELLPGLPGFAARVVGVDDGVIHVSARDPQD